MSRLARIAGVVGAVLIRLSAAHAAEAPAVEASGDARAARLAEVRRNLQTKFKKHKAKPSSLAALCERWGVPLPADLLTGDKGWQETPELVGTDPLKFSASAPEGDRVELFQALAPRLTFSQEGQRWTSTWSDFSGTTFRFSAEETTTRWGTLIPDAEVAGPGTRVVSGLPSTDPAGRFSPYLARGVCGNIGIYERQLRNPLVDRNVSSFAEGLVEAAWSASPPRNVPEEYEERAREMATWVESWTVNAPWWPEYIEHAASCLAFGFAPFEAVWGVDEQNRPYIRRMAFREQCTVDRWMWDARGANLVSAQFRSTGDHGTAYLLPARGEHILDHRLMVVTYRGRGNNIEGRPPGRSLDVLLVLWELLWKIAGACFERFGSPVLTARYDAALLALPGKTPDAGEVDIFLDYLSILTALDTPTLEVPLGLLAEYVGPSGEMPDVLPLIEKLEATVDRAYATQAMGLGQRSSHGSYALAKVQDDDRTRALPAIGRVIVRPFIEALGLIAEQVWGIPARYAPRLSCVPEADVDASAWITDALRWNKEAPTMPAPMRTRGNELLGLPGTMYDDLVDELEQDQEPDETQEEPPTPEPDPEPTATGGEPLEGDGAEDIQKSVLNGAQISSMKDVILAVSTGELPGESAIAMLELGFQLSPEVARRMIEPAIAMAVEKAAEEDGGGDEEEPPGEGNPPPVPPPFLPDDEDEDDPDDDPEPDDEDGDAEDDSEEE